MTIDYSQLGFKCGLEIHQQLEGKKLFCSCPTLNIRDSQDISFTRRLRAVAGETGEIDVAAAHEMTKGKEIEYVSSSKDTCLVEFDEEPPHQINRDALKVSLEIAFLLNAKILDEIQVMRKTVVDGSNVSGFQRTALIAIDGFIDTSQGRVNIPTICLEEEAAQKIEETDKTIKYRLDRLGIPLIEIATDASIKSAEHAKEAASTLGMMLRSTGKVKKGLGTIRQDVNLSIKSGARTEIKGFQDLKAMPKVIENEIKRQITEIEDGKKIVKQVRKAEADFTTSYLRPMPGAARMYPETDISTIKIAKSLIDQLIKPELIIDKAVNLQKKHKITESHANEIIKQGIDFEKYANKFPKVKAEEISKLLIEIPKDIKSRLNLDASKLKPEDFEEVLGYMSEKRLSKEALTEMLCKKISGEKIDLSKYEKVEKDEIEAEIKKMLKEKPELTIGAYMGLIMQKFKGKADGKKVMVFLNKH